MSLNTDLQQIQTDLTKIKSDLDTNLTAKGATPGITLTDSVAAVANISINSKPADGIFTPEILAAEYPGLNTGNTNYHWSNTNDLWMHDFGKIKLDNIWDLYTWRQDYNNYQPVFNGENNPMSTWFTCGVPEADKFYDTNTWKLVKASDHSVQPSLYDMRGISELYYVDSDGSDSIFYYDNEPYNYYSNERFDELVNKMTNTTILNFYIGVTPSGWNRKISVKKNDTMYLGINFDCKNEGARVIDNKLYIPCNTPVEFMNGKFIRCKHFINFFYEDKWYKDIVCVLKNENLWPFLNGGPKTLHVSNRNDATDIHESFIWCDSEHIIFDNVNSKFKNVACLFYSCNNLKTFDLSNADLSLCTDLSGMFYGTQLENIDLSKYNIKKLNNVSSIFFNCHKLKTFNFGDIIDGSEITSISEMFSGTQLENIDLSNFGLLNISSIGRVFEGCKQLKTFNLGNNCRFCNDSQTGNFNIAKAFASTNFNNIDLSKYTQNCESLKLGESNSIFENCTNLKTFNFGTNIVLDASAEIGGMQNWFKNCLAIESVDLSNVDISGANNLYSTFENCGKLKEIKLYGNPMVASNKMRNTFNGISNEGTLIYDDRYDYSKIIEELNKDGRHWICKSNIDINSCESLTITADDVVGNETTTKIHYTANVSGTNIYTGEHVSNKIVTGETTSEPFEKNTSLSDSRQITVSYTYMGKTATTTITQGPFIPQSATVNIENGWELAPTAEMPNPDESLYQGVYRSTIQGQDNSKAKMNIKFSGMSNFELYIRSYAESSYDYIFAGKLDDANPTEDNKQAATNGNQQSGTAIENYTKVEYPNDGGEHTVTIVYRKDGSGASGDDRGYVLFKKPMN